MSKPKLLNSTVRHIYITSFVSYLKDLLDVSIFWRTTKSSENKAYNVVFNSNELFWKDALNGRLYPGQTVKLQEFSLLEWIPMSPGLFHTPNAAELRYYAMTAYLENRKPIAKEMELPPPGKTDMVMGGFGSLRLAPRKVSGELQYIICGSSSGVSHEGVALFIKHIHYEKIIKIIKDNSVPVADITGKIMILPNDLSPILTYDHDIPKYYLEVEEINVQGCNATHDAAISIAIMYTDNLLKHSTNYSYSFYTIQPSSDNKNLKGGVDWLKSYAKRHSGCANPVIVSDFDEYYNHFGNTAFPIKEITNGIISPQLLKFYQGLYPFSINLNLEGDMNIISDSTIGAVGSNAIASNNNFLQTNTGLDSELDFNQLEYEINHLLLNLNPTRGNYSQIEANRAVKHALSATKSKNSIKIIIDLLEAGDWAYKVAKEQKLTTIVKIIERVKKTIK